MIEWFYLAQFWVAVSAGIFSLTLGAMKKLPSLWSIGSLAIVLLGLVAQLVISIFAVVGGESASVDTVEYFAYLLVAIMVPIGAGFWGLVERNRWSTMILGVASLTVAVMLVRMHQIWTGSY
ncbi:MAG: hypothetical protein RLZZ41_559 [Actinomycetota bacterium]